MSTISSPSSEPRPTRSPQTSACAIYREVIVEALSRGRNAMAIWQNLVDGHGFRRGYASVRRFVATLQAATPVEARVVITTAPGEEAQVEYGGDGPMVRDPLTGKYRRARLFVLTLGYSRKAVRLLTWRSSAQIWAELHEQAFRRLGGTVKVVVLDISRGRAHARRVRPRAQSALSRCADVLRCGRAAVSRPRSRSQRQGRSRRAACAADAAEGPTLRESRGRAEAYLDQWEARWADTRIHGTTKRQVAVMFAEERPALGPLPLEPFRYYRFGTRTVHLDGCVEVEAAYYGAPPGWIGRRLQVQWNDLHVRLLDPQTGQLLREHLRTARGHHRILDDDRPARTPLSTLALLRRADAAGPQIGAVCRYVQAHHGAHGVREVLGILALAKKHGPAVIDDAARVAVDVGVLSYRFIRNYIDRRPPLPLTLTQVDPLIRELARYRVLIDQKTGDPT
jgi:hypothetical protein